ncbi:hypothetical protein [Clostridium estertheticum]|uniref:hypothetical protein n=1 Tax=Clostridium estertheticum TaxID=238834 RepID=UPI001C0B9B21|nr:hypothetical protein [Clostridium estertheticum]MBU3173311.1 hypothetical protein [Clostridium estertheticum]
MARLMFVQNFDERQFAVRVISKGDKWGRNRSLTFDNDTKVIEFYDVTYAGTSEYYDELGQFVTSYNLSTIMEIDNYNRALSLIDYEKVWSIDGCNIYQIQEWIKKINREKVA